MFPSATADGLGFVAAADVPLVYFDKPYVIGAQKGSDNANALFVRTLRELEQVGIALIVLRTTQHLAAIYPYQDALVVEVSFTSWTPEWLRAHPRDRWAGMRTNRPHITEQSMAYLLTAPRIW